MGEKDTITSHIKEVMEDFGYIKRECLQFKESIELKKCYKKYRSGQKEPDDSSNTEATI
ncbi:5169_t:CDS:2, partial [Scutellospora calospora]